MLINTSRSRERLARCIAFGLAASGGASATPLPARLWGATLRVAGSEIMVRRSSQKTIRSLRASTQRTSNATCGRVLSPISTGHPRPHFVSQNPCNGLAWTRETREPPAKLAPIEVPQRSVSHTTRSGADCKAPPHANTAIALYFTCGSPRFCPGHARGQPESERCLALVRRIGVL